MGYDVAPDAWQWQRTKDNNQECPGISMQDEKFGYARKETKCHCANFRQ
jgi:hypothetical protein